MEENLNAKSELIEILIATSAQLTKLASLLSKIKLDFEPNLSYTIPRCDLSIDFHELEKPDWPVALNNLSSIIFNGTIEHNYKILEYHVGQYSKPISAHPYLINCKFDNAQYDLISSQYYKHDNIKIIGSIEEATSNYDFAIINESLEFNDDPIMLLIKIKRLLKPHGKIYIRVRPWTSCDGGFQSSYFDKAFAHLLTDLDNTNSIKLKFNKPEMMYETLFNKAGLMVMSKLINCSYPDHKIINNEKYMDIIIKRTWGAISIKEAVKTMSINTIDYILI